MHQVLNVILLFMHDEIAWKEKLVWSHCRIYI